MDRSGNMIKKTAPHDIQAIHAKGPYGEKMSGNKAWISGWCGGLDYEEGGEIENRIKMGEKIRRSPLLKGSEECEKEKGGGRTSALP